MMDQNSSPALLGMKGGGSVAGSSRGRTVSGGAVMADRDKMSRSYTVSSRKFRHSQLNHESSPAEEGF